MLEKGYGGAYIEYGTLREEYGAYSAPGEKTDYPVPVRVGVEVPGERQLMLGELKGAAAYEAAIKSGELNEALFYFKSFYSIQSRAFCDAGIGGYDGMLIYHADRAF